MFMVAETLAQHMPNVSVLAGKRCVFSQGCDF